MKIEFEAGFSRWEKPEHPQGDWIAVYLFKVSDETKDALTGLNPAGCIAKKVRVTVEVVDEPNRPL